MPESIRFFKIKYPADINERHWNVTFVEDKQIMKIIYHKVHENDCCNLHAHVLNV